MPELLPFSNRKRVYMRISLLGTTFSIKVDEEPEYVSDLVEMISQKLKNVENSLPTKDPLKTAIITCLLLSDELEKVKRELNTLKTTSSSGTEADEQAEEILGRIEKHLRILDEWLDR